jgi:hypothetical protein
MNVRMLGLSLVALFVAGCSTVDPHATATEGSSSPTASYISTASPADVLDAIVIAKTASPTDTQFFQSLTGRASGTQMVQDSPSTVQAAVLEGFVDALTREFASVKTAAVIRGTATPDELDPSDLHFVGSIAVAYESERHARAALRVFSDTIRAGSAPESEEQLALGDGGVLFRGTFLAAPSAHYIWSDGSLVLALAADGMTELETNVMSAGMQSRVPRS